MDRSNAYLKGCDYYCAIADATKAIRMDSSRRAGLLIPCRAASASKSEISEGLSDATRATQLNPRDGLAWDARSEAELLKSRFSEAMTDASARDRDRQWTRQCVSDPLFAYRETGEFGRSVADLTKAISLEPKNGQLYADRARRIREGWPAVQGHAGLRESEDAWLQERAVKERGITLSKSPEASNRTERDLTGTSLISNERVGGISHRGQAGTF